MEFNTIPKLRASDISDDCCVSVKLTDVTFSICDGKDALDFSLDEALWLNDLLQCGLVYRTVYKASFSPGNYVFLDYSSPAGHLTIYRKFMEASSGRLRRDPKSMVLLFYTEQSATHKGYESIRCEISDLRDLIQEELENYSPTLYL